MKFCLSLLFAVLFATAAAQALVPNKDDKEPAKSVVAGQVVQEPGSRPIRKANLQLTPVDQDDGTTYTATSDTEGHFKIENVKPGRYSLRVEHSGFSGAGKHDRRSLTLDPGQELKDLVFHLQAAAVIAGKIMDTDGDPVPGVWVVAQRYAGSHYRSFGRSGHTNDLGEYRIGDLQSGRYLLKAISMQQSFERGPTEAAAGARPSVPYPTYYPGTTDKAQAVPLELRAGEEMPANFALAYGPAFRIRGTVGSIPVIENPGLTVVLRPKDNAWLMAEAGVKKDGSFDLGRVLPGSYTVLLMSMTAPAPQVITAAQTFEVKDTDLDNVRLTPTATTQVRGQMRMEDNQKIDWADVTITLDPGDDDADGEIQFGDEHENTSAQVKKDGSFDLKTVPSGTYHLTVFSQTTALRDCFVKSINAGGKDVADSGFTVSGGLWSLDIVVSSKGAMVEGAVVDDKNRPVADADVVLIPDANRQRRDLYQSAQTDQHGRFKLRGINPGGYRIMGLDDLEEDFRNPEFAKAHDAAGQTLHVDEDDHKSIVLKIESSGASLPN